MGRDIVDFLFFLMFLLLLLSDGNGLLNFGLYLFLNNLSSLANYCLLLLSLSCDFTGGGLVLNCGHLRL